MNVGQLLGLIRERGIELVADGERLRCIAPPGALTAELSAQIREAKPELLALLSDAAHKPGAGSSIPRTLAKGRFPLSFTQQRAVVAGRIAGALPTAFLLRGVLDVTALRETLRRMVARHMPLHSRFFLDAEVAEQELVRALPVDLPTIDLGIHDEGERAHQLRALLADLSRTTFDVGEPPLFRFTLVRLGPDEHVLHTAFNVLVFDGWSFDVFWQEMREGYAAIAKGEPWPPAPLPISYEDYVAWQHKRISEEIAHQATFWKDTLGEELPPLPLPTDRPRPRVSSTRGKSLPFELSAETAAAIRRFAQQHAVTPQIVMLASLYALLARMGGTRDIVIASPVDARTQPSMEGLIGPFVNLLLLRSKVDLGQSFASFVGSVRELCLAAYDHQEFPLEQLGVRSARGGDGGFLPAFQVEFSYQQVSQRGSYMGTLSLTQLELESGAATNDLTLWVKDWGERVAGAVEFKLDLFDRETIEHWVACYKHMIRALVKSPDEPMCAVDLLGPERERIEARLAQVCAAPPIWAVERFGGAPTAPLPMCQVVDDEDRLQPFGIPGHLAVLRDGKVHRVGGRARLAHDGTLTEVVADVVPRTRPVPVKQNELRTELEMRICQLFEALLGLSSVGVTQDYFELGGNSLSAVRLFSAIQEQFGVRLPVATILEASTPRKLAAAVKQKARRVGTCAVRLKEGSGGPTLFLIHDGDGEILLYRNLALRMPKEVSVYGIEPFGADRVAMVHTTIEEIAGHYVEEIRKLQPTGPYYLGGLCAGGLLAFEVARQLEAYGEDIEHLALVEASPPLAQKRATLRAQRWQRFSGLFHGVSWATATETARKSLQKLKGYLWCEGEARYRRSRARSLCVLLRHVFPGGKDWPQVLPAPTVREVFALAEAAYIPSKLLRTRAVIYRATQGEDADRPLLEILADPLFGWQEYLAYAAETVDVPGGHGTLLREPHVAAIASRLCVSFARVDGSRRDSADSA